MKPQTETNTPTPAVIGVDIGKEIFHVVAFGVDGKIALRRKIRRLGRSMQTGRARPGARAARSGMPRCAKRGSEQSQRGKQSIRLPRRRGQAGSRDFEAERFGGLEIDGEPVLRGSLN